jgi:predicted MFS family arabinose efflux permease
LLNRLMERVPEGDRPAHMALHNLGLNLGILVGSLLGPIIAGGLGLQCSLLLAAGLRLLSGVLFVFLG